MLPAAYQQSPRRLRGAAPFRLQEKAFNLKGSELRFIFRPAQISARAERHDGAVQSDDRGEDEMVKREIIARMMKESYRVRLDGRAAWVKESTDV